MYMIVKKDGCVYDCQDVYRNVVRICFFGQWLDDFEYTVGENQNDNNVQDGCKDSVSIRIVNTLVKDFIYWESYSTSSYELKWLLSVLFGSVSDGCQVIVNPDFFLRRHDYIRIIIIIIIIILILFLLLPGAKMEAYVRIVCMCM